MHKKPLVGCAFAINGKLSSVDVYLSNGLLRKMCPNLLSAGATEAIAVGDRPGDRRQPKRWLRTSMRLGAATRPR
jgi:hypothetical protein